MHNTPILLAITLLAAAAHAQNSAPSSLQGDPAHPASAHDWVETRLYFGLGPADRSTHGVTEAAWRRFLDSEVTPRFPSGLSAITVYGQWQSQSTPSTPRQRTEHLRSKMLIIDYPATPENLARIEAIRSAWKQRTGDQSVLKVTEPVDVSF